MSVFWLGVVGVLDCVVGAGVMVRLGNFACPGMGGGSDQISGWLCGPGGGLNGGTAVRAAERGSSAVFAEFGQVVMPAARFISVVG